MLYFPVYTLCRHVEGPSSFLDGPSWLLFGSCIEVDAVGYPDEHVTVGDAIVLGHAHADAVTSGVDHRLEMARRVDPVVDSALGCVGCAGYPYGFGDNLTVFTGTADAAQHAVDNWINSPGHFETMIDSRCDCIGVGVTQYDGITYCYMFVGIPNSVNFYA